MISLPWIALSLVTKLVTVALDCPRVPSGLVTELVTLFTGGADRRRRMPACIQASFSFRASLGVKQIRRKAIEVRLSEHSLDCERPGILNLTLYSDCSVFFEAPPDALVRFNPPAEDHSKPQHRPPFCDKI